MSVRMVAVYIAINLAIAITLNILSLLKYDYLAVPEWFAIAAFASSSSQFLSNTLRRPTIIAVYIISYLTFVCGTAMFRLGAIGL